MRTSNYFYVSMYHIYVYLNSLSHKYTVRVCMYSFELFNEIMCIVHNNKTIL